MNPGTSHCSACFGMLITSKVLYGILRLISHNNLRIATTLPRPPIDWRREYLPALLSIPLGRLWRLERCPHQRGRPRAPKGAKTVLRWMTMLLYEWTYLLFIILYSAGLCFVCLQRADVTRRNFVVTTVRALTTSYNVISILTALTAQTNWTARQVSDALHRY